MREALRQLATEGLVTIAPGRGAMVTRPDPAYIRDVFLVRNPLEATAARLAAERITPEQLRELQAIEAELDRAGAAGDRAQVTALANRFHIEIYDAAGRALLKRLLVSMQEALVIFRHTGAADAVDYRQVHHQHSALLAALERHDPAAAEQAMNEHMRLAEDAWQVALVLNAEAKSNYA